MLDGLRAMDPATRKAAVTAMDAADEAWAIEDCVLDAERKARALKQGGVRVDALAKEAQDRAQAEIAALDDYVQKAADTIRKQITDLEKLLQEELQKAADKRAQIQGDVRNAREAAARERTRYEQESQDCTRFLRCSPHPRAQRPRRSADFALERHGWPN